LGLKKNTKGNYLLGLSIRNIVHLWSLQIMMMHEKNIIAFTRRGGEKNLKLLKQAIDLRYELAQLFGKASYADWALKTAWQKHPEAVNNFWQKYKKL
jgi:thimet oligopeptidase